jgi:hypothetical protein
MKNSGRASVGRYVEGVLKFGDVPVLLLARFYSCACHLDFDEVELIAAFKPSLNTSPGRIWRTRGCGAFCGRTHPLAVASTAGATGEARRPTFEEHVRSDPRLAHLVGFHPGPDHDARNSDWWAAWVAHYRHHGGGPLEQRASGGVA